MKVARPARVALALVAALALIGAGCGGGDDPDPDAGAGALVDQGATVIVANSPGTLTTNGHQRVLVALLGDGANEFLGGDDVPAAITFVSPDGGTTNPVDARWLSTVGAPLGVYVVDVIFPVDGRWGITVEGAEEGRATVAVDVFDDSVVPDRGDPAPPSDTPTIDDVDHLDQLTTDLDPDPAFYRHSIAEAVANGRPTVVVFATPAFCQTALCGPTIDIVKEAVAGRDDLDVVHVEPFDLDQARAGTLVPVPVMAEWRLATEPWVFVVDAEGIISASFEGILAPHELEAALAAL